MNKKLIDEQKRVLLWLAEDDYNRLRRADSWWMDTKRLLRKTGPGLLRAGLIEPASIDRVTAGPHVHAYQLSAAGRAAAQEARREAAPEPPKGV